LIFDNEKKEEDEHVVTKKDELVELDETSQSTTSDVDIVTQNASVADANLRKSSRRPKSVKKSTQSKRKSEAGDDLKLVECEEKSTTRCLRTKKETIEKTDQIIQPKMVEDVLLNDEARDKSSQKKSSRPTRGTRAARVKRSTRKAKKN
jgi:hypothetical protein